ncbi:MAG: hypothetical protein JSS20_16200 [Proteobacteria bacterium]|nr:hypothetical protein [Pseudomonadota bacterium]
MARTELIEALLRRRNFIEDWLNANALEALGEQRHLDDGSGEQAYWNHGYQAAISDILLLLEGQPPNIEGRPMH